MSQVLLGVIIGASVAIYIRNLSDVSGEIKSGKRVRNLRNVLLMLFTPIGFAVAFIVAALVLVVWGVILIIAYFFVGIALMFRDGFGDALGSVIWVYQGIFEHTLELIGEVFATFSGEYDGEGEKPTLVTS